MRKILVTLAGDGQEFRFPNDSIVGAVAREVAAAFHVNVDGMFLALIDAFGNPLDPDATLDGARVEEGESLELVPLRGPTR